MRLWHALGQLLSTLPVVPPCGSISLWTGFLTSSRISPGPTHAVLVSAGRRNRHARTCYQPASADRPHPSKVSNILAITHSDEDENTFTAYGICKIGVTAPTGELRYASIPAYRYKGLIINRTSADSLVVTHLQNNSESIDGLEAATWKAGKGAHYT